MTCKACIFWEMCVKCNKYDSFYGLDYLFDILAEQNKTEKYCKYFKDKSKFIELPCKLHDIVYVIPTESNGFDDITRMECLGFQISEPTNVVDLFRRENGKSTRMYQPSFDMFGDTVFFTKEEAEQKLKELSND